MARRIVRVGVTLSDGWAVVKRREQAAAFPLAARPVGSGHGRRLRYRQRDAPGSRAGVGDPGGVAVGMPRSCLPTEMAKFSIHFADGGSRIDLVVGRVGISQQL